jgi:hypothetical protein
VLLLLEQLICSTQKISFFATSFIFMSKSNSLMQITLRSERESILELLCLLYRKKITGEYVFENVIANIFCPACIKLCQYFNPPGRGLSTVKIMQQIYMIKDNF